MKLTTSRVHDIAKQCDTPPLTLSAAFAIAGIDIVADPEPEIARPIARVSDAFFDNNGRRLRDRDLDALVSAYNAAGERKRISVASKCGDPERRCCPMINGEVVAYDVADYLCAHASDLGLEIVET